MADRIPSIVVPIPSRENVRSKALRLLVTGAVRIKLVRAGRCWASVNGDSSIYDVGCSQGRWHCTCPGLSAKCSHIAAVRMLVDLSGPGDAA